MDTQASHLVKMKVQKIKTIDKVDHTSYLQIPKYNRSSKGQTSPHEKRGLNSSGQPKNNSFQISPWEIASSPQINSSDQHHKDCENQ
jgi:hypothetical protein